MTQIPVLPTGFALPSMWALVGIAGLAALVGGLLYRRSPPVTSATIGGLAPWMVAGASGYVLYQIDAVPVAVRPLLGAPLVYVTTAILAALVWMAVSWVADRWGRPALAPVGLAAVGVAVASVAVGAGVWAAPGDRGVSVVWPGVGLLSSLVIASALWWPLRERVAHVEATGAVGWLVLFAHTVDGVSTAIGMDVLRGFGEQTPLSRLILEAGASLPTAPYIGGGWLFVLVKLGVASAVLVLLAELVETTPRQGNLLLGLVAAVGLGPGAHNLLLFAVG